MFPRVWTNFVTFGGMWVAKFETNCASLTVFLSGCSVYFWILSRLSGKMCTWAIFRLKSSLAGEFSNFPVYSPFAVAYLITSFFKKTWL